MEKRKPQVIQSHRSQSVEPSQDGTSVGVFVRVRPPLKREIDTATNKYFSCVAVDKDTIYATKNTKPVIVESQALSNETDIAKFDFSAVFDEDATQELVYRRTVPKQLQAWIQGINCTLFAYGISGSGKTHTIEGTSEQPGILPRVAEYLFSHIETVSDKDYFVEFSAIQVYMEKTYDLLDSGKEVKLRTVKEDVFFEEPYKPTKVTSLEQLMEQYKKAQKSKVVAFTMMNSASTRGHVIYSIQVTSRHVDSGKTTQSKFNLVDLSGSERVLNSGVTGERLRESITINQSLSTLVMVVEALVDKKSIRHKMPPFRDSKLTLMLRDSLGGKCLTNMIITVSPALYHAAESLRTLQFGSMVKFITNKPTENYVENKYFNREQYYAPKPKQEPKKIVVELPWKGFNPKLEQYLLDTKFGKINVIDNGASAERKSLIILMHACPSDATELLHFFPCLTHYGYRVVAFDQPGYGNSPGKCHPSRSDKNLDKGGPADIAEQVAAELGFEQFIAGGYDWGAGIALSLAQRNSRKVSRVIALLPSWTTTQESDIKAIAAKVLVLWIKHDQMHNWSKWKTIANKLPNKTIHVIESKVGQQRAGGSAYSSYSDELMRQIVIFLGLGDPLAERLELRAALEVESKQTDGSKVIKNQVITLRSQVDQATLAQLAAQESSAKTPEISAALKVLAPLVSTPKLNTLLSSKDKSLLDTLRALPPITPKTLRDNPAFLVDIGVWESLPNGLAKMWSSPRYFPGRKVLVSIPTDPRMGSQEFLYYVPGADTRHASHRATIESFDPSSKTFKIKVQSSPTSTTTIEAPLEALLNLNHPQDFKSDSSGTYYFEDGIKSNYSNLNIRAKLYEMAMLLSPIIKQLDFDGASDGRRNDNIVRLQKLAIRTIRKCLNINSFAKGADRERIGRTDDIGLLAINGQGQCHGLSSTLSAYLLVFSDILGLDILYRGGTSYWDGGILSNSVERHQWVQVNRRPSMESVVCDLWAADAQQNDLWVCAELEEGMMRLACPHDKVLLGNAVRSVQPSDIQGF